MLSRNHMAAHLPRIQFVFVVPTAQQRVHSYLQYYMFNNCLDEIIHHDMGQQQCIPTVRPLYNTQANVFESNNSPDQVSFAFWSSRGSTELYIWAKCYATTTSPPLSVWRMAGKQQHVNDPSAVTPKTERLSLHGATADRPLQQPLYATHVFVWELSLYLLN